MKVETDIISSISASPIGRIVIVLIMIVEKIKTDVIIVNCINHHAITRTDILQYHGQSVDTENITQWDQTKNVQFTDEIKCCDTLQWYLSEIVN